MDDFVHAAHGLSVQLLLTQFVQPVGRVEDASTSAGNVFVGQSPNLVNELSLAASGIDDMCVRVAERRQHRAALCIDGRVIFAICRFAFAVRRFSEILDASVFDGEPCVGDGFQMSHFFSAQAFLPGR